MCVRSCMDCILRTFIPDDVDDQERDIVRALYFLWDLIARILVRDRVVNDGLFANTLFSTLSTNDQPPL